jgi:hypothetical protein
MLISEPKALKLDPIAAIIGSMNGNTKPPIEIMPGVYERPDFGGSNFLPDYEQFNYDPENQLSIGEYGVCDNIQQILEQCPELENDLDRQFVITVTPVLKKNQSNRGGWRWHKWGEYIGNKVPQCEYLFDEPEIDGVLVYHIYTKKIKEK